MLEEIRFETKPEMALDQIRALVNEDMPRGVPADAAMETITTFAWGCRR